MRNVLLVFGLLIVPAALSAQQPGEVLAGLRNGGGWVTVPIRAGVGSVSTATMPTVGMTIAGCINVWGGHSGEWEIRARDVVTDSTLVVRAVPGVGVPFSHTFGMKAQVDFAFRWSEPRDTTLMMWIGVAAGRTTEEACQPVYGG